MIFTPSDSFTLICFVVFTLVMLTIIQFVFKAVKAPSRFLIIWWAYLILFSAAIASGLVKTMTVPVLPLLFVSLMALYVYLAFSDFGKSVSHHFSLAVLIGFQCFRLPLELILHRWAAQNTIPKTMTWTGQNWDVITGIASLVAIPFLYRSVKFAYAVNALGFILLLNVLRVVVMSSPLPFAWPLENPLQLAFYFPYCLIAPLFVGPALFGHLVAFRKLKNLN